MSCQLCLDKMYANKYLYVLVIYSIPVLIKTVSVIIILFLEADTVMTD